MTFRTLVETPRSRVQIAHDDHLLLLGSCFADEIGRRLQNAGFDCDVNPFGTLYNPASLRMALERLLEGTPFTADELTLFPDGWGTWMHHSRFSASERDAALATINGRFLAASQQLRQARVLIVTFGTNWAYVLKEYNPDNPWGGTIVGNCHKVAGTRFDRVFLGDEERLLWKQLLERLHAVNCQLQTVFTVSPIRHLADGAHENQLSKSALLLLADHITAGASQTHYFPAYELILDDLRDYRFYADDMVHPSSLAVDYIWERFGTTFFSPATAQLAQRAEELRRALDHKPFRPDSEEYRAFREKTMQRAEELKKEIPFLKI